MSTRVKATFYDTLRLLDEFLVNIRTLREMIDEEGAVKFQLTLLAPRIVEALEENKEKCGYVAVVTDTPLRRKTSKSEDDLVKKIFGDLPEETINALFEPDDEDEAMESTENTDPQDEKSDVQVEGKSEDPDGANQGDEGSKTPEKKGETTDNRILKKEEVRVILNRIAKAGHEQEVKNLLAKYGAKTLGQVDAKDYAALVAEAEVLTDG